MRSGDSSTPIPGQPADSIVADLIPPHLLGADLAAELVSATGWALSRGSPLGPVGIEAPSDLVFDPSLRLIFEAVKTVGVGFTWGLVRQELLEQGMAPGDYLDALLASTASRDGYVHLGRIPNLIKELTRIRDARRPYLDAAEIVLKEQGRGSW